MRGFQSFCIFFLHHFVLAKLATSSIRFKPFISFFLKYFVGEISLKLLGLFCCCRYEWVDYSFDYFKVTFYLLSVTIYD